MTVKRMLGVGVLTFVVTAGGFVLPPAAERLEPPAAVVPGGTRAPADPDADDRETVDVEAVKVSVVESR